MIRASLPSNLAPLGGGARLPASLANLGLNGKLSASKWGKMTQVAKMTKIAGNLLSTKVDQAYQHGAIIVLNSRHHVTVFLRPCL